MSKFSLVIVAIIVLSLFTPLALLALRRSHAPQG
jgi:hypothetical protein